MRCIRFCNWLHAPLPSLNAASSTHLFPIIPALVTSAFTSAPARLTGLVGSPPLHLDDKGVLLWYLAKQDALLHLEEAQTMDNLQYWSQGHAVLQKEAGRHVSHCEADPLSHLPSLLHYDAVAKCKIFLSCMENQKQKCSWNLCLMLRFELHETHSGCQIKLSPPCSQHALINWMCFKLSAFIPSYSDCNPSQKQISMKVHISWKIKQHPAWYLILPLML